MKKDNKKKPGKVVAIRPEENPDRIAITATERQSLIELNSSLVQSKAEIGEFSMAILELQGRLAALQPTVKEKAEAVMKKADEIARKYGIDPEDPVKGKWVVKIDPGVFERVG